MKGQKKKKKRVKVERKSKKKGKNERGGNLGILPEMEFEDEPLLDTHYEQNHATALSLPLLPPLDNSITTIQRQVFEDRRACTETFLNNL